MIENETQTIRISLALVQVDGPPLDSGSWRLSDPFRIGRAASNELELPDPGVSRRHASVERANDGWIVRDCGSRQGIELNGLALAESATARLRAGDILRVGPWQFRIDALADEHGGPGSANAPTRISVVRAVGNLAEQRLELLLQYAGDIAAARDEAALAEILAEHALLGSGYARATVLWRREGDIIVCCQRPALSPRSQWQFNAALVASAGNGDLARLESDTPPSGGQASLQRKPRRAMCVPIMLDGRAEAFLYLDSERTSARRHADAPTFCHALARLAALALSNLHRLEREREHAAFTADLERARDVQKRLLPAAADVLGAVRYALHLHPGRVVGGDVVDVFEIDGGRVVAALGDVSGAGLGAGLVMASVQSFLRAGFAHDGDPVRVVSQLNAHLCAQTGDGRFVTLWLGVFEPSGAGCHFVDAGHGHALRIAAGSVQPLSPRGCIPLGIDAQAQFVAEPLLLGRGEIVLLYSDGVVEQRGADGAPWGTEGLSHSLASAAAPADAVALAWKALGEHAGVAPEDDATMLALAVC
ncbi:MAG: SpoIIE family protein phosphatase [Dokdonella sp.]